VAAAAVAKLDLALVVVARVAAATRLPEQETLAQQTQVAAVEPVLQPAALVVRVLSS